MQTSIEQEVQPTEDYDWQEQVISPPEPAPAIDFAAVAELPTSDLTPIERERLNRLPTDYQHLKEWLDTPIITDRFGFDHAARRAFKRPIYEAAGEDSPAGRAYEYWQAHLEKNKLRSNEVNRLAMAAFLLHNDCLSLAAAGLPGATGLAANFQDIVDRVLAATQTDYESINSFVQDVQEIEARTLDVAKRLKLALEQPDRT